MVDMLKGEAFGFLGFDLRRVPLWNFTLTPFTSRATSHIFLAACSGRSHMLRTRYPIYVRSSLIR